MSGSAFLASASDVAGRILASGAVELSWFHPDDLVGQGIVFDVYQSTDPTDLFRTAAATSVAALVVQLDAANLAGDRYFSVIARRGTALALPSRAALVAVPRAQVAAPASAAVSAVRAPTPSGDTTRRPRAASCSSRPTSCRRLVGAPWKKKMHGPSGRRYQSKRAGVPRPPSPANPSLDTPLSVLDTNRRSGITQDRPLSLHWRWPGAAQPDLGVI